MRNLPHDPPKTELQLWHSLGGIEHICELRKSCMVLYGIFVELARMIYHDPDGRLVGTPEVIWRAKDPEIWIDSELRWEDQHPEFRPAIYVQLGPLKCEHYIPGYNGKVEAADRFGERHYEQKVTGSVTFMHIAATAGEACALADNTDYALTMLQDPIRDDFCFTSFYSAERHPLEKSQPEASEKYISGVTFGFEFSDAWDVKEESPILKSIEIVNSDGHDTVDHANIFTENKISGKAR